jgi:hypothetical protein
VFPLQKKIDCLVKMILQRLFKLLIFVNWSLCGQIVAPDNDDAIHCQDIRSYAENATKKACRPLHFGDDLMFMFADPCPLNPFPKEYDEVPPRYSPLFRQPYLAMNGSKSNYDGGLVCLLKSGRFMVGICDGLFCGSYHEHFKGLYWCNDNPFGIKAK